VYFWNADDAAHCAQGLESARAEISFPVLPVLRGGITRPLQYPSGTLLAAAPSSAARGTWQPLHFEITPQERAVSYRIRLSRQAGGALGEAQELVEHPSAQASFELPAGTQLDLAPGEYSWEAWAIVDGLDVPLGSRSFDIVDDAPARAALAQFDALAEPARSSATLAWLVEHARWSDARAFALRRIPTSPERDAFLAGFPGR
jgi:hypothetical protein